MSGGGITQTLRQEHARVKWAVSKERILGLIKPCAPDNDDNDGGDSGGGHSFIMITQQAKSTRYVRITKYAPH